MPETKPGPDAKEQLRHYYSAYRTQRGQYIEMKLRAEEAEELLQQLTNKIQYELVPHMGGDLLREFKSLARKAKYHLEMSKKINQND